jgi:type II secretion system protein G
MGSCPANVQPMPQRLHARRPQTTALRCSNCWSCLASLPCSQPSRPPKTETAKAQISAISTALELYALDNGGFPQQQTGLSALVAAPPGAASWKGPYLKRAEGLIDPWGRPYGYRFPGRSAGQAEVFTLGRDNAPGGTGEDQDISN